MHRAIHTLISFGRSRELVVVFDGSAMYDPSPKPVIVRGGQEKLKAREAYVERFKSYLSCQQGFDGRVPSYPMTPSSLSLSLLET